MIAAERWGEGLATEAAAAAIADAFGRVRLERLVSWTTPDNLASRRVMEKCGLRHRGTAAWKGREHVWYDVRSTGRPGRLIGPPKSSFRRSSAPHSSQSTWNADGRRASQEGHRATSVVSHWGQVRGRSSSWSSK